MSEERAVSRRSVLSAGAGAVGGGALVGSGRADEDGREGRDTGEQVGESFTAGAARVDATPTEDHLDEGVWLGGYGVGRGREATGVLDGCDATAVAIGIGDVTVAIVSIDVPGIGNALIERIRKRARSRAGLDPDHVLVAATHTHAGPDVQGLWGGVPRSYRHRIVERASHAIELAVERAVPASASVAQASTPDFVSNRRGWEETVDDLTAIHLSSLEGDPVGTLVTYPAHTVVIGADEDRVAKDYPGELTRTVEAELGGVCAFVPGVLGDASPESPLEDGADLERANALGEALGAEVLAVLEDPRPLEPRLRLRTRDLRVPMDNCVFRVAYDVGLMRPYYHGETAPEWFFDRVASTLEPVGLDGLPRRLGALAIDAVPLAIDTQVSRLTLGEPETLEVVTVPGEAVTNLGLDMHSIADAAHVVPLGMTHDTLGYLLTGEEFGSVDGETYEETVSMGPDTGERYLAALETLFGNESRTVERTGPLRRTCSAVQVTLRD